MGNLHRGTLAILSCMCNGMKFRIFVQTFLLTAYVLCFFPRNINLPSTTHCVFGGTQCFNHLSRTCWFYPEQDTIVLKVQWGTYPQTDEGETTLGNTVTRAIYNWFKFKVNRKINDITVDTFTKNVRD